MVFGGVVEERIQLNEDSVWAGEVRDRINPAAREALPQVRRLIAEGRPIEAEALADTAIISIPRRLPPYQTLGDLHLAFADTAGHAAATMTDAVPARRLFRRTRPRPRHRRDARHTRRDDLHPHGVCERGGRGDCGSPQRAGP